MRNEIQKNFREQMQEAEINLHEDAEIKGKGVFTNKLFELRFYGYNSEYKAPSKLIKVAIYIGFIFAIILVISMIPDIIKLIKKI